uniref:Estradiol 17-beta-dehydrogenase 12 n=1 Tax=Rhabditophanes sp. KR3021 TaxID=114890 RepID=A0AC35TLH0_9BILA
MLVSTFLWIPYFIFWIISSYITYRLTKTILKLIQVTFVYLILPYFHTPDLKKYSGRWTVVSGGTDGIGKAYMMELASRGLKKFVIVGRSLTKLESCKRELEQQFGCKVQIYVFDFLDGDYSLLRQFLSSIDIGFVVNSVGVGRQHLEKFGENIQSDYQIMKVNCLGAAEFMSCCLPVMEKYGGGEMVVLSSSQGEKPIPLLAAYSAGKSFMTFICDCVNREYKNIHVQTLIPALVATNMTYYTKGSLFVVTPQSFAKSAINSLGVLQKTAGCFNHEFQMLAYQLLPWSVLKHLIMPIYWLHQKRMITMHGDPNKLRSAAESNKPLNITITEEKV